MNYSTAISLVDSNVYFVGTVFNNQTGNRYVYKTIIPDLKEGDIVVVETKDRLGIATVADLDPDVDYTGSEIQYKWVVTKLDLAGHQKLLESEKEIVADIKRAEKRKRQEAVRRALADELDLKTMNLLASVKTDD